MMSGRRRNPIDEQFPEPDGSKAVLLKRIIFAVFALMTTALRVAVAEPFGRMSRGIT
jgi:hypothetical protein